MMLDGMTEAGAYGDTSAVRNPSTSINQHTLKNSIHCTGVGLHSGERISLSLHPAEVDTGVIFKRSDVAAGISMIPALYDRVVDTRMCTKIANEHGTSVGTIEHLMAAIAGCGIDNVVVELDGPEVPVMDGSSEPFVFLIDCAGLVEQDSVRRAIVIDRPVRISEGDAFASLEPADSLTISLGIDFKSPAIGKQDLFIEVNSASFKSEISRARTFGFLHEVEALRAMGLARGGSLDNAVVVSGDKIMNEDGLRYEDEFVRHKVLDCIGDISLAGGILLGHLRGVKTGHALNNRLLHTLFADSANWHSVPMDELLEIVSFPMQALA